MAETFLPKSKLEFEFDGAITRPVLEKMRQNIEVIIAQNVFGIRNGKVELNFDHEGTLQEISFNYKKWRKEKLDRK